MAANIDSPTVTTSSISAKQPRENGSVPMTMRPDDRDGRRNQQVRYLAFHPQRPDPITQLELLKDSDRTAPIVMAITVEARE